ncbi:MAG: hypothetical protein ACREQQ_10335 [Candidatus Binatia bacterium]
MECESRRSGLGVFLAVALVSLSARAAGAATLGMVADNLSDMVTVFNADTDTILGSVPIPNPENTLGDCAIPVDRRVGYVTNFNFEVFQIDLTQSPPVLRSGVNPIAISNAGEDASLSPRGEYLLVCDGSGNEPVSVVLTQKRLEIGTFDLGSDCNSVDVCSNARSTNSSVIVTSSANLNTRRLRLDTSGKLVDTGDVLPGPEPQNANCAPQGTAGVVLHRDPSFQSFIVQGLAPVDMRATTVGRPISGAFNAAGTVLYVRNGPGDGPNAVDVFTFNPTTGALGATPSFSIPIAGTGDGNNTFFGMEQMALNPAGTKLYVSVPGAVEVYNATTAAFITSITDPNIVGPTGVCIR